MFSCLQSIQGDSNSSLTTPSLPAYDTQRLAFDRNFDYKPVAIYYPATVEDAVAAIKCAAAFNISIAPRSGGHSFEAYSVGGRDGSLVIDLAHFQQFSLDSATGIATVGAGTRLGPLYARLWKEGQYLIAAGTCPAVGIGGIALGGGVGMAARKHGATTHNIVGMTMVSAEGKILEVSASSNSDLFWALRGAGGGSFGLVTEFQIRAFKAPPVATTLRLFYPVENSREVIHAFTTWASTVSADDLYAAIIVSNDFVLVYSSYFGTKVQALDVLEPVFRVVGEPTRKTIHEGSWYEAVAIASHGVNVEHPDLSQYRYHRGRALVYRKPLSVAEIEVVHKYLHVLPRPKGSTETYITIELWGGKINRPDASPAAFDYHRGVLYSIQFGVSWDDPSGQPGVDCVECIEWSAEFAREMQAVYSSGPRLESYQNYMDRDLPEALDAYYGPYLPRLKNIKRRIDPTNVFSFPQSIPLPAT
ncbi:hypothetical protein DFQ27_009830 [Actinomortierella ambigua]|uniref:FAD-binding PCMH-type domain-containing protein n=1 Tax=Actinomortierella ambigua TaxID=1343610 RepID=A0A9P6QIM0_9FUNG|nr:hypothetical protein DFQ27_009830 [Actinomortierella ambigua]